MATLNQIIQNIKERALLVSSQNTISDDRLALYVNDELNQYLIPLINEANQEYLIVEKELELEEGQTKIRIPSSALGGILRSITAQVGDNHPFHLKAITREERELYQSAHGLVYYIQGNTINLVPDQKSLVKITLSYVKKPSRLVFESDARRITSINPQAGSIVVTSSAPFIKNNTAFDIVSHLYPNEVPLENVGAVSITNNQVVFPSIDGVEVGDWLAAPGTTPLAPIQDELIPLLEERVVLRVHQSLNDELGVTMTLGSIASMEASMKILIENRVAADPVVLVNHFSPFRAAQRYR